MTRGNNLVRKLLAVPLAVASLLVMALPAIATTDSDLYVNSSDSQCSDTGPGTQGVPFCTIQHAADTAMSGQTVDVENGYYGETDITRSGITFAGIDTTVGAAVHRPQTGLLNGGTVVAAHAFVVNGASDVKISGFDMDGTSGSVVLNNATRVTVDGNVIYAGNDATGAGVSVTGQSSAVTISRNQVADCPAGISVGQGVTNSVVTTNQIFANNGPGVAVTDATGIDVTSNSIYLNAVAGISIGGASSATVENNVLSQDNRTQATTTGELTVSAASAAQTTADYNLLYDPQANTPLYTWSGTNYPNPAAFTGATTQGSHDLNADPKFTSTYSGEPTEGAPEVDSANSNAPGELATDFNGNPRVDDPLVPNTGVGINDRGAFELQDPYKMTSVVASPKQGPYPLPVTVTVTESNPWNTPMTYTYTFDDGSAPVTTTAKSVSHTYTQVSPNYQYNPLVKATAPSGKTYQNGDLVQVTNPGPMVAKIQAMQIGTLKVNVDASGSTDPWKISDYSFDYGDGTTPVDSSSATGIHSYANPGTYTITVNETDTDGQHATAKQQVSVAGAYVPDGPVRVLDTRTSHNTLGTGGQLGLKVTDNYAVPATGVSAVVLNVTATNASDSSFLTVYPDGTPLPNTSNLDFTAGQTIPNLVTVPVGADGSIDIANHFGSVDVVVDLEGYYATSPSGVNGGMLDPLAPQRVLDTRQSWDNRPAGPVGPGQTAVVDATRAFGYQTASAVVLNVTVTNPTTSGFLTVYANGSPLPNASNLNFTAGQTTSNLVIVPVSYAGQVAIYNHFGTVDVVADIQGYFTTQYAPDSSTEPGVSFTPLAPNRLLDTRSSQSVGPNGTVSLPITDVPPGAKAVVLNVTVADATANSFLTVYPGGTGLPETSNLNFDAGQIAQNQVIVPIGADGTVTFHNIFGSTDVIADIFGFYGP